MSKKDEGADAPEEMLEVYDLSTTTLQTIKKRSEYEKEINDEYLKSKKISTKVKSIRVLLMSKNGRMYLQKRAKNKKANPGMLDKPVGGHVAAGHGFELTLFKECAEELGFPATTVDRELFKTAIKSIDLATIGIFWAAEYLEIFESVRVRKDGSKIVQPYITQIYIGYYDGAIRFKDGEACGLETFSLEEFDEELKTNEHRFTEDIKFMVSRYRDYIKPII